MTHEGHIVTPSNMNSRKIFVGGLDTASTESSLQDYFERFGKIQETVIMQDRDGKSRGFGFCTFSDTTSLDKLFSMEHEINGKKVECKHAFPKEEVKNNTRQKEPAKVKTPEKKIEVEDTSADKSLMQLREMMMAKKTDAKVDLQLRKIFVGGLPHNLALHIFRNYFIKFGEIDDIVILQDKRTMKPRGFGFVTFRKIESANQVLKLYE